MEHNNYHNTTERVQTVLGLIGSDLLLLPQVLSLYVDGPNDETQLSTCGTSQSQREKTMCFE